MATSSAPRTFAVTPPPGNLRWMIVMLVGVPEVLVAIALFVFVRNQPASAGLLSGLYVNTLIALPLLLIGLGLMALLLWASERRRVALANGVLDITATLYRRKLQVSALNLDAAQVLNLEENKQLAPLLKTNGIGLPGLSAGWFRSRKLVKLFCLLTVQSRVLYLPERDGGATALSVEKPFDLLQALRETADGDARAG